MLLLKYLLLLTGWGLLVAAAVNVIRNLYQVVQYHRQLRHIAPPSSELSTPDGIPTETPSTHGLSMEKPHLNWTAAKAPDAQIFCAWMGGNGRFLRPGCRSLSLLA